MNATISISSIACSSVEIVAVLVVKFLISLGFATILIAAAIVTESMAAAMLVVQILMVMIVIVLFLANPPPLPPPTPLHTNSLRHFDARRHHSCSIERHTTVWLPHPKRHQGVLHTREAHMKHT